MFLVNFFKCQFRFIIVSSSIDHGGANRALSYQRYDASSSKAHSTWCTAPFLCRHPSMWGIYTWNILRSVFWTNIVCCRSIEFACKRSILFCSCFFQLSAISPDKPYWHRSIGWRENLNQTLALLMLNVRMRWRSSSKKILFVIFMHCH